MAVLGPMARSAADLSLLLDVIAGPDPLDTGVGYKLALPPPRHNALKDFRVLVIDSDPVLPANKDIRGAIEKLADNLARSGVSVARQSPLWPDFAESSRLYMRMLISFLATFFLPETIAGAKQRVATLDPNDTSLAAERLRGMLLSHSAWVLDDGARARLRAQWRELFKTFDAVICPVMPTPAYPHDHSPEQEARRINIDGKDYVYPDQLAWPGVATLPGLPATAIPIGLSPEGLPIGVQIIGPWLEDRTPLKLAELIEREFGGFVPPPMFDD
jgi:amidase